MTDERIPIREHLGTGFREFFRWLMLIGLFGLGLAGISTALLADDFVYAMIACLVTLAETLGIGILLSGKRAIMRIILNVIQDGKQIRGIVRALFDLMIAGPDPETKSAAARTIERIPFAEAERRMNAAVSSLLKSETESTRWRDRIKLRTERRLLDFVQTATLKKIREQDAQNGKIDLQIVRQEVEDSIDTLITRKVESVIPLWTIGVLVGLPVVVALQTWGVLALLKMK